MKNIYRLIMTILLMIAATTSIVVAEEAEKISESLPLWDFVLTGIPTAVGAWGTYKLLTGDRSPAQFARVMQEVMNEPSVGLVLRKSFQCLKTHELAALIATKAVLVGCCAGALSGLIAAIVYRIKAYCATGADRETYLCNVRTMMRYLAGNLTCGVISGVCLFLLADYAQSGAIEMGTA